MLGGLPAKWRAVIVNVIVIVNVLKKSLSRYAVITKKGATAVAPC